MRSEDFERVLGTRTRVSSPHFALHHLPDRPSRPARRPSPQPSTGQAEPLPEGSREVSGEMSRGVAAELSTGGVDDPVEAVDDLSETPLPTVPEGQARLWLGTVVPKRHARRSVTRSLLKRQMRHAVAGCGQGLPDGLWVLRLRAPFDRKQFPSAASDAMRKLARVELMQLLADAVASPVRAASPVRRRR